MSFEKLLRTRYEPHDGQDKWTWIASDTGAWDGPLNDFQSSHKSKYLKHCKKFDTVVCAGGNQGMYPRSFSNIFSIVYTFEPDPLSFHCLVNNCQSENIVKIQAALGNSHDMIKVIRDPTMTNVGTHTVDNGGFIPQLKIDDFNLFSVDLIQLDIEGYEIEALRGGMTTIEKFKPLITVERTNPSIESLLFPLGYKYVDNSYADTFYKVD